MAERPGFMIYFDTAPAFERLDDADAGRLIKALLSYSSMGELLPLDGMASLAFDLIRPKLDRDAEKYVEKIQKRKYAGYSKACRDRGEEPLDLDSWLEGQNEQVGPLQNRPIKNKRGLEPERVSKPRRLLYS